MSKINIDYLDKLYALRHDAEQELADIQKNRENPVQVDEADKIFARREENERNLKATISNYKYLIEEYVKSH